MNKTDTKELWNSLCSISGFVTWDKPNGGALINDLLMDSIKDFDEDNKSSYFDAMKSI